MMLAEKYRKNFITKYLNSESNFPAVAGLASSLYPVLFYYSQNLEMLDSWGHFLYFSGIFIIVPIFIFVFLNWICKFSILKNYRKYVIPFFSLFVFLFILKTLLFIPIERKLIVYSIIASLLFSFFLNKHWKKLIILQLLLALLAMFSLGQILIKKLYYDESWKHQPDNIENVVFTKTPNVYFFEPDGYIGFKELGKPPYSYDNTLFENFLSENTFKTYPDFRANYVTTLASNGATFSMKHHYYDFNLNIEEVNNANNIIISDNPVLNAFKKNGYETYFLSESHYFLLNRPKMGYDHCSIDFSKISYLHNGMGERELVVQPFIKYLNDNIKKPKFFFVQLMHPWHINSHKNVSEGVEVEKKKYFERLEEANKMLKKMFEEILKNDPNALIIMMADHGGYVGFEYTKESYSKIEKPALINSVFKANLTLHWPENYWPDYDDELKSSINVFRILFAYLSENRSYLKYLQPNESYIIHKSGDDTGVYKYFDNLGNNVYEKINDPKRD